jgi:hypothetical protein
MECEIPYLGTNLRLIIVNPPFAAAKDGPPVLLIKEGEECVSRKGEET